jgi:signal transduction histidine kinase
MPETNAQPHLPPVETPNSSRATCGKKILLVDDEKGNRTILRKILEHEGYVVAEADSAEAAFGQYAAFCPDLVLLDVLMPGMNGFNACREIHRRYHTQAAPIIFITARSESHAIVEGFDAGGVDYVLKPFRQGEVVARIHTHLQLKLLLTHKQILLAELSQADSAKNRFLGMAAHDLRNPLASIRGLAEFLLDGSAGQLNPAQDELVHLIQETCKIMESVVNDLLDWATIEAGELKLEPKPIHLNELLVKSVRFNGMTADRKKTRIMLSETREAPLIRVDENRTRQVIDNLLSNAIKYSPAGSTIHVVHQFDPAKNHQIVRVRDQGPGIPQEELGRLFTDFGRLSTRPTGGEPSTGLGLAICRKIVESHHGTIEAENLPSGGCEFRVCLRDLEVPPNLRTRVELLKKRLNE